MKIVKNGIIVVLCVVIAVCCFIIAGESFPPAKGETAESIKEGKVWLESAVIVGLAAMFVLWALVSSKSETDVAG